MDISKYRDNVELSDISIIVDDHEYNLHKFPLSINSEYFKDQCRNENKIVLKDFPGEWRSFELIADHCYGKEVTINQDNVFSLLCCSKFLGMTGKNNFIEKCERFIDRIFRTVEYSKSIESLLPLMESILGFDDEKIKEITERTLSIIVDLWLKRKVNYKSNFKETYFENALIFDELLKLSCYWMERLIEYCSVDENKHQFIGRLAVQYISVNAINRMDEVPMDGLNDSTDKEHEKDRRSKRTRQESSSSSLNEVEVSDSSSSSCEKDAHKTVKSSKENIEKNDSGELIDRIIFAIPDNINLGKTVSIDWLQKCFQVYQKFKCKSKGKLLRLCGGILVHLPIEDIKTMDPKHVTELIDQILKDEKVDKELMKWIWDNSLLEMARNDELDPVVFSKVLKNMPESEDVDPDVVFQIVLSTLNKIESDGKSYEDELINCVKLDQISPDNLEVALESKFWKAEDLCKAAISRLKINKKGTDVDKVIYKPYITRYDQYEDSNNGQMGRHGFGNRNIPSWKNQSIKSNLGESEDYTLKSYDPPISYYSAYKYSYGSYPLDSYLTLEENLKYELKKISDSYITFYKDRFPLKPRRRHQCSLPYDF